MTNIQASTPRITNAGTRRLDVERDIADGRERMIKTIRGCQVSQ